CSLAPDAVTSSRVRTILPSDVDEKSAASTLLSSSTRVHVGVSVATPGRGARGRARASADSFCLTASRFACYGPRGPAVPLDTREDVPIIDPYPTNVRLQLQASGKRR